MAETQIDRVPLITELWLLFPDLINELRDRLDFALFACDETFQLGPLINQARLCPAVHEINNLREDRRM
jgi:hypothetical protein